MTAAEEATSSASAASRSCGMTSTRVRRISEGVLSRNGPQDWFRAFACVGRYHKLSGTVRPTKADVAARFIARNTAPAPEMGARALTWGAGEKVLLVLAAAGWLASRGQGEPLRRAGNHALLVTVAASLLPMV